MQNSLKGFYVMAISCDMYHKPMIVKHTIKFLWVGWVHDLPLAHTWRSTSSMCKKILNDQDRQRVHSWDTILHVKSEANYKL